MAQSAEDERTPEEFAEDRARERDEIAALAAIVRPLLAASPDVPARASAMPALVAPAELARGLLVLLRMVPATNSVDRTSMRRIETKLTRIGSSLTRRTTLTGAIAVLTSRLRDSVPAPDADGSAPWTSAGGHLHLSDLEHGGHAGRRATFIVGLDAARFPGGGGSDALLVDDDRRRLTAGQRTPALPTSAERIDERRHAFAALVARLRGRVTFSYATWDAVEGLATAPAAEMLQAYRLLSGDATADYDALHGAVAPSASAVPRASALLDADDVWLHALASGDGSTHAPGALRRGVAVVCGVYPHLDAGVRAWKTRLRSREPTAFHGVIAARPGLDPRDSVVRAVSPTQLQVLGACPHRYLLRYVLRVKKPDDPELSPEQWLPALERGSLMHTVFERALRQAHADDADVEDDVFVDSVLEILDDQVEHMKDQLPPPGGAVFEAEVEALREDVRAFVEMVREDARAGRRFIEFERKFGRDGAEPVEVELPDGHRLRLAGAIDRIDRDADGRLTVIDYKTGSRLPFSARSGVYDGGRRLQHVLYANAAERLLGADVAGVEYHFPTRRNENYRARYARDELREGLGVVTELLDFVARGWFVPTNMPDDCRFCDYAATCRVKIDAYGKVDSPLAEWSREADGAAVDLLRRVRR
jgi:ATP-dependent helicase/nuclease subunit B